MTIQLLEREKIQFFEKGGVLESHQREGTRRKVGLPHDATGMTRCDLKVTHLHMQYIETSSSIVARYKRKIVLKRSISEKQKKM